MNQKKTAKVENVTATEAEDGTDDQQIIATEAEITTEALKDEANIFESSII